MAANGSLASACLRSASSPQLLHRLQRHHPPRLCFSGLCFSSTPLMTPHSGLLHFCKGGCPLVFIPYCGVFCCFVFWIAGVVILWKDSKMCKNMFLNSIYNRIVSNNAFLMYIS